MEAAADAAIEILTRLAAARSERGARPFVLGIAGPQGSGKSTLAREIVQRIERAGERAVALSLDDFYLPRQARRAVAAAANSLFATRGPPGTHDIALALQTLRALKQGAAVSAPVFDKGVDDRSTKLRDIPALVDVIVFEGWCLGAAPAPDDSLAAPLNMLERVFDCDGVWRRAVNAALHDYQVLFAEIDYFVYLRPPSFGVVHGWRAQQENDLKSDSPAAMRVEEIAFFVQHFERLTRSMMSALPVRADLTLQLDVTRRIVGVRERGG